MIRCKAGSDIVVREDAHQYFRSTPVSKTTFLSTERFATRFLHESCPTRSVATIRFHEALDCHGGLGTLGHGRMGIYKVPR